jgi:hypothetical protein
VSLIGALPCISKPKTVSTGSARRTACSLIIWVVLAHSDGELSVVLGLKEWQFVGMMHDWPETEKNLVLSQRANVKFMSKILDRLREDGD